MATMVDHSTAEQVLAEARRVRFSRVVLVAVLGFFWAFGWIAGHSWLAVVFCVVAVRRGWRDSTGWVPPAAASRGKGKEY